MTKNAERREQFQARSRELASELLRQEWRNRLGEHHFEIGIMPLRNDPADKKGSVTSLLGNGKAKGTRGPSFRTFQFIRTAKCQG